MCVWHVVYDPYAAISARRDPQITNPQNPNSAAKAPSGLSSVISDVPPMFGTPVICGSFCQKSGRCAVAQTDPSTKNSKTISMRDDPPPVVNNVPDAQPPPNCIPIPKTNAFSVEDRFIGIITGCMF